SASTWVWTGTSRCSAPSERNCSRLGRIGSSAGSVGTDGPSGEAGRCVRVAGGSGLVDQQQQSVGVAVEAERAHVLDAPRGLALGPVFAEGAPPVGGPAGRHAAVDGCDVHPREREDLPARRL